MIHPQVLWTMSTTRIREHANAASSSQGFEVCFHFRLHRWEPQWLAISSLGVFILSSHCLPSAPSFERKKFRIFLSKCLAWATSMFNMLQVGRIACEVLQTVIEKLYMGDDERASCSFQKLPIASGCAVVPNSAHIVSKKQSSSVSCSARAQS